jgi:Right handed beta helix region/Periplasmic copper-binding protein (NosD)
MKRTRLLVLGFALVLLAPAPGALADHKKFVVDDDRVQCPDARYTAIQAAVTAAPAGATVLVCKGTYREEVLIATPAKNDLTVKAKGKSEDVVLDGLNTMMHGFELENVSGVLIEGFHVTRYHDDIWLNPDADGNTIRKNMTTFAWDHDGIVVQGDHNLIERNLSFGQTKTIGCGISVGTGGSFNVVRRNETYNNPNTGILLGGGLLGPAGPGNRIVHNHSHDNGKPLVGAAGGTGILNAISPGAVIAHNFVHDNNRHGILVTGALSTGVVVAHNKVVHNGSTNEDDGIRLADGAAGNVVAHNDSRLNRHDGIHLTRTATATAGANNNVVEHNHLFDNGTPGAGNGCGVDVDGGSANNIVSHNKIVLHDRAGIRLRNPGSGNVVRQNEVRDAPSPGDGILLINASGNIVESNHSIANGRDGIRIEPTSSGDTILRNHMRRNGEHDCHDDTVGPGTAGTANFWLENRGETENRAGLCEPDDEDDHGDDGDE